MSSPTALKCVVPTLQKFFSAFQPILEKASHFLHRFHWQLPQTFQPLKAV